ncbi:MAG: tRNA (adenosine(37)-N6)-threonylcarbamoyltransferase complex ATPase subunit type 1 TsaE [Wenzhouxiangellaceae bacterium]
MNDEARGIRVEDEAAMLSLGARLAAEIEPGVLWTLSGDLGAGKTTLVRGLLRGLGFDGRVKSPSYGLVESYELPEFELHHLDLYRLADPGELEYLGVEDLIGPASVVLVEWPERAGGRLPPADRSIRIEFDGTARRLFIAPGPRSL